VGLIHLDAGVVIGLLDADDAHHKGATTAIARVQRAGDRISIAASAFAECLVAPSRRGDDAVRVVDDLASRLPIEIVELDADIARTAAGLRAHHRKLRLPDALVIATAVSCSADELITTDRGWPSARSLKLDLSITQT
jgi:predicted nucleic acid-binding protein